MATINVKDATGNVVAIEKPLTPGRAAAAASRPVALSNEDSASLAAVAAGLPGGIALAASTALEVNHVIKSAAGKLYGLAGYLGAAGWVLVFDAASAPADGAVTPLAFLHMPSAGSWSMPFGLVPASFATGIVVCASTTGPFVKTAAAANNAFSWQVQ